MVAWLAATWRRFPPGFVGMGWFMAALLPVSGLLTQVGQCPYADRHTYPAHVGLAIVAAWGCAAIAKAVRAPKLSPAIAVCLLAGAYVVADERLIAYWKDDATLWPRVLALDSTNLVARFQRAVALERAGDFAGAEAGYRETLAIGDRPKAVAGLARACLALGKRDEAMVLRVWAERLDRDDIAVRALLAMPELQSGSAALPSSQPRRRVATAEASAAMRQGLACARREDYPAALEHFQAAIGADPEHAAAHNNAGLAAMHLGDRKEAERCFVTAIRLEPDSADFLTNLARLYSMVGRNNDALPLCERASKLAPHDSEIALLLERLRQHKHPSSTTPPR